MATRRPDAAFGNSLSETGALLYETKLRQQTIYPAALARARATAEQRKVFRIIAEP